MFCVPSGMSMQTFCLLRVWVFLFGLLVFPSAIRAEEAADSLLAEVAARYRGLEQVQIKMNTRSIRWAGTNNAAVGPDVVHSDFYRLVTTYRAPGDHMRLVYLHESERGTELSTRANVVMNRLGTESSSIWMLQSSTREKLEVKIPPALFPQEATQRIGTVYLADPVLAMLPRPDVPAKELAIRNAKMGAEETVNGKRLLRVNGYRGPYLTSLWIDADQKLIVRMRSRPYDPKFERRFFIKEATESVYSCDFEKGRANEDFDGLAGWGFIQAGISAEADFGPLKGLRDWLESSMPDKNAQENPGSPSAEGRPAAPTGVVDGSTPPASVAASTVSPFDPASIPEQQSLSAEQMGAIVLVEGESGVGTGFITTIKDVPFVVTNQHVIGGNQTLRVTTLSGVQIKTGPIFGAVGRDIAILRITDGVPPQLLKLAVDPLKTAKIGDRVVVVGNRRGGGVATQVSGGVQGIGPDKLEVNAPFQPGNSGSPIIHVSTGEVLGLATYSQTRKLDFLDGKAANKNAGKSDAPEIEQRWFGYRVDGVASWQAIDLVKWREQEAKLAKFRENSEAIYQAMLGRFDSVKGNATRVRDVVAWFEDRYRRNGSTGSIQTAQDVVEFFRRLRGLAEDGKKELRDGDFYDYFRCSLYWETSITAQLETREEIRKYLDEAAENRSQFLSRMKN